MKKFIYDVLMLTSSFLFIAFQFVMKAMPVVFFVLLAMKMVLNNFPLSWAVIIISPIVSYVLSFVFTLVCACLIKLADLCME